MKFATLAAALAVSASAAVAQQKSHRIPPVDLKQRIIWGAECNGPDGTGLAFGGQDQQGDEGGAGTRIKVNGEWKDIRAELRSGSPLREAHAKVRALAAAQKDWVASARALYFRGLPKAEEPAATRSALLGRLVESARMAAGLAAELTPSGNGLSAYSDRQAEQTAGMMTAAEAAMKKLAAGLADGVSGASVSEGHRIQIELEKAAELLGAEPPARALSPIVYDEKTKRYFLFGGDHLDYLTNDVWLFDPAAKIWRRGNPKSAPPPRADHKLRADGDGKIVLSGGYTYTSSTDYVGAQYRDIGDGEWVYDIAADTWTPSGEGKPASPDSRTYRTGALHPDYYLQGARPDAAAAAERLRTLPANTWVSLKPPHLPKLNRDWGTAVLDANMGLILRFSGGHSAHGGSDVLHYHIGTNRWELPFPVEFPLGQLYNNTEYPAGFNFNQRPFVTGHTYQSYGFDAASKLLVFTGQTKQQFFYDPARADWIGKADKPAGMNYGSCFYTLTLSPAPDGTYCWTNGGRLFKFDSQARTWGEVKLTGEKLPGSVVDNSTIVADTKRNRLLAVGKPYGKPPFDGQVWSIDLKTGAVAKLSPTNMAAAAAVPYLCQLRYDPEADLLLVGGTLPPDDAGVRRTPAYDCAANKWVTLKLAGDDPSGKTGRNVSLGMMHDPVRKVFWAVDTNSSVFVLRLDKAAADVQELK